MSNVYCCDALTNRYEQLLDRIETLNLDLQSLVDLLDANIEAEEEHSGVCDPAHLNYPSTARRHRIRRQNLIAAISQSQQRSVLH